MKAMTCEMCNSNELVKQDGMFVCQSCGTKYSIEEAKKLMIEGTVDVQGTVKIDNSDFIQKQLTNARRAKQKEDWEETERYYNLVEQNDPDNIEAIFYSSYAKAMQSLTSDDIYKRQAIFKTFINSISIIDDNYDINDANAIDMLCKIIDDTFVMRGSSFVYNTFVKNNIQSDNKHLTYALFNNVINELAISLNNIAIKYGNNTESKLKVLKLVMHCFTTAEKCDITNNKARLQWLERAKVVAAAIKQIDPTYDDSFIAKNEETVKNNKKAEIGCGIVGGIIIACIIALVIVLLD